MLGSYIPALRASMGDLGGLAARGASQPSFQPSFVPQTSYGMMAQFQAMFHQLAEQLRHAERDAQDAADDDPATDSTAPKADAKAARRLKALVSEATVILGYAIPTKDLNTFNQMVQDGYIASVSQLLEAMEAHRLDDQVYQAFLDRLRRLDDGGITLKRDADGAEHWQIQEPRTDGLGQRALEPRRYDPDDPASFGSLMARIP